jgi:hypothetical protein
MPDRTATSVVVKPSEKKQTAKGVKVAKEIAPVAQSAKEVPQPAKAVKADFESFLTALSARDRLNIERHIATCEAEPTLEHAKLYKRLAGILYGLAPQAIRTTGQRAVQFFVADGKYRVQAFALEDLCDGKVTVYLTDALDAAISQGILKRRAKSDGDATLYELADSSGTFLALERLTSANTVEAPDYYRHMLGWNRKALRLTLPSNATTALVKAAEGMFVLAVGKTGN